MNVKRVLFLVSFTIMAFLGHSQTYNINSSGTSTCAGNTGIDADFICASNGGTATLGSFTDTNPGGSTLTSISFLVYGACAGDVDISINGTSFTTGSTPTTLTCSCQSIDSDPAIPQSYPVTLTPAMQAAYVMGGANTLTVTASNSASGSQCFYGADVIVNETAPVCNADNGALTIN